MADNRLQICDFIVLHLALRVAPTCVQLILYFFGKLEAHVTIIYVKVNTLVRRYVQLFEVIELVHLKTRCVLALQQIVLHNPVGLYRLLNNDFLFG